MAVLALVLLAALGLAVALVVVFVSMAVPVVVMAVIMIMIMMVVMVMIMTMPSMRVSRMGITRSLAVGVVALTALLALCDEILHRGIKDVYLSGKLVANTFVVSIDNFVRGHNVLFAQLPAGADLVHSIQLLGCCTLGCHYTEGNN